MKLLFFFLAQAFALSQSGPETIMPPAGEHEVARMYAQFEAGNSGCRPVNDGPRILLTGFGLFAGVSQNMSGLVLENLAAEDFWPADQPLAKTPALAPGYGIKDGTLDKTDNGARIYNRAFTLNGVRVSACLIVTDVLWDFAGAVIAYEIERFQPQVVLLSGIGNPGEGRLEAGASNAAMSLTGFMDDGSQDARNVPSENRILTGDAAVLPMTWNNAELAPLIKPYFASLGFTLVIADAADPDNDYVCNNVSYIALAAAAGHKLSLAGGLLVLSPKIRSQPKIGFFHYPSDARKNQAAQWAQIVLTLAGASL